MGTLIGKAYPTKIALNLADHTYVECGTGAVGWGCWGGKIGGREIVRGTGSTNQANTIAASNERAGITCYAINGVCHQAANRILWPSRTLVSAASGYWVSSSLYGTYGQENKNWLHVCEAPFDQHNNISGDLPACTDAVMHTPSSAFLSEDHMRFTDADRSAEKDFAEAAMSLYTQMRVLDAEDTNGHINYQIEHFSLQSQFRLGEIYDGELDLTLRNLRADIEKERLELNQAYAENKIDIKQFAEDFNKLTIKFQDHMAETLKPEHYRSYFCLERSERIILLDPEIIDKIHTSS
jgi:hypothetical protein